MSRTDEAVLALRVGTRDLGQWDGRTGGGADSDENTYYAGGGRRVVQGGKQTVDTVTLSKLESEVSDDDVRFLLAVRGDASYPPTVTRLRTGAGRAAVGRPRVWSGGVVKTVTLPDDDSNGNAEARISVVITPANVNVA